MNEKNEKHPQEAVKNVDKGATQNKMPPLDVWLDDEYWKLYNALTEAMNMSGLPLAVKKLAVQKLYRDSDAAYTQAIQTMRSQYLQECREEGEK